ncbi:unnamed protein product [Sphagnum troendelagicum]|uniref:Ureide permease 1-like n=1 Tax=Sphagnum troendelagicum TaxID=128251 RepID=A0ABP0TQD9_9BRYO
MYLVQDKGGAIALMVAALCFLGTWPALLNLVERQGRNLMHTYLDYSFTNYLVAIIFAFTLGQIGSSTPESPNFLTQLPQDNGPSVGFAIAGGLVLGMGNLMSQYAWPFVGLSIANVISASITVVGGTTMNYFLDDRINKAQILFPGVGCFLIAVFLGAALHASYSRDNLAKLQAQNHDNNEFQAQANSVEVKAGSAQYLTQLEEQRAMKITGAKVTFGLAIAVASGICFALFSPAFNLATNDQWHRLKPGVPHLVVYTAFFYFSTMSFVWGITVNTVLLYRPLLGLPKSSLKMYINDWRGRQWALLAGLLCGLGNGFQFMGGQAAGYAAADAVQALPLVSTFWGVLIFKEYYRSSRQTYILLAAMLIMFSLAVCLLASSSGTRKTS